GINDIGKHWWFSLDGHGLVDLSLCSCSERENPLIYCNRSVGGGWEVVFITDAPEKQASFLKARRRGCLYVTLAKKRVSNFDSALTQNFTSAKEYGIQISYGQIADHCERLLNGTAESLTYLTQTEAWRRLEKSCPG